MKKVMPICKVKNLKNPFFAQARRLFLGGLANNHFSIKNKSLQSKIILAKTPKNNRWAWAKNGFFILLSIIDHTWQNFKKKMKNK
jgi:hypothetical protein